MSQLWRSTMHRAMLQLVSDGALTAGELRPPTCRGFDFLCRRCHDRCAPIFLPASPPPAPGARAYKQAGDFGNNLKKITLPLYLVSLRAIVKF